LLRIRNLESGYGSLRVLKGISLHVNPGEIVTIIGANGAGKTTLLETIAGIVRARSGEIVFDGASIASLAPERIVSAGCSLVPEGRRVFATMTVRENLVLGAYTRFRRKERSGVDDDIAAIHRHFPILRDRDGQLAGTLSGGEQQMLAIGRSMMARPRLIMLDEPSMGLAPIIVKGIFEIIGRLRSEGNTILLVEQNATASLAVADRGYVMETGQIVLDGTARELMDNHDVQRAYLGKEYRSIGDRR
jgi:branched-chain amino acid transport system ATP-binding protein